jgi:hypothetical protein
MDDPGRRLEGLVRQSAEEVRNIRSQLTGVSDAVAKGETERAKQRWDRSLSAIRNNRSEILRRFTEMEAVLRQSDECRDGYGSEVTRLGNLWETMDFLATAWERNADNVPATSDLAEANVALKTFVYESAIVTVPRRLDQHLASYRPGQVLDFAEEFKDEIDDAEDRKEILKYLFAHPLDVSGIVDVEAGTVTRISPNPTRRVLSLLLAAVLVGVTVSACWLLGYYDAPSLDSDIEAADLSGAALLVISGMALHMIVGAFKDLRRAASDPVRRFTAFGNWMVWLHSKEVYVAMAILWAGVLAYVVGGVQGQTSGLTLLAVGYSGDSFVDVLLPKFDKGVLNRSEKARKAVAGDG